MLGYIYTTEKEAINARQLCAIYKGLPNLQGDTLYWVNYDHAPIELFYFIQYVEELENVLGQPTEFDATIPNIPF
jgi:hypothetical protein